MLLGENLAVEPLLQLGERGDALDVAVAARHDDLAVERRAVGQRFGDRAEVGEGFGDQFLAARPQPPAQAPLHQLRADAVELPFGDPALGRPELFRQFLERRVELMGEEERIGPAVVGRRAAVGRRDQRGEIRGADRAARLGVAHQPLRHRRRVERRSPPPAPARPGRWATPMRSAPVVSLKKASRSASGSAAA